MNLHNTCCLLWKIWWSPLGYTLSWIDMHRVNCVKMHVSIFLWSHLNMAYVRLSAHNHKLTEDWRDYRGGSWSSARAFVFVHHIILASWGILDIQYPIHDWAPLRSLTLILRLLSPSLNTVQCQLSAWHSQDSRWSKLWLGAVLKTHDQWGHIRHQM